MSILKTKLKIVLVGFILYQGALLMHKQDNGYNLPDMDTVKASYGFTSPAYANDNTGIPVDIPYNPYIGENSSHHSQMQAAAAAEAQKMLETGDIAELQSQFAQNPAIGRIIGY